MALELAAILDEWTLNLEWIANSTKVLNRCLSSIPVTPGHNIVVSIADRNYLIRSDDQGLLNIECLEVGLAVGTDMSKILGRAQCRVSIDGDVLNQVQTPEDIAMLIRRRRLLFSGDTDRLNLFESEIIYHVGMLREEVEKAGPGSHVLQKAIEEHNKAIELKKEDPDNPLNDFSIVDYDYGQHIRDFHYDGWRLISNFGGWVHYSAASTPTGNAGQANYNAANSVLDNVTYAQRTSDGYSSRQFIAQTIGWGAVGGMGMRWKAFASQDIFGSDFSENSPLQTMGDAQIALSVFLLTKFELADNQKLPTALFAQFDYDLSKVRSFCLANYNDKKGHPWKTKGRGGGITLPEDDVSAITFHNMPISISSKTEPEVNEPEWVAPGKRVRIHGLTGNPEMNDKKGTLVEEVKPGVWHVRLDDGIGNKLLKVKNMMRLSSHAVKPDAASLVIKPKIAPKTVIDDKAIEKAPTPMSIAGNWTDWYPRNMEYDSEEKCYSLSITIPRGTDATFGVSRGVAGDKPWKRGAQASASHHLGRVSGDYKIKVFVSGCQIDVKWEALGKA